MIFIGSAILSIFGMLLLLRQAIRIAGSLVMICYYLIKFVVSLTVAAIAGCWLVGQWCVRTVTRSQELARPEPRLTINICDADDLTGGPVIELPRTSFRRLRG